MNKFLLQELETWCDSCDTIVSKYSVKEENGIVKIYRYDGTGFPKVLHTFRAENDIRHFLKEAKELREDFEEYNNIMTMRLNSKLNKAEHRNKKNEVEW